MRAAFDIARPSPLTVSHQREHVEDLSHDLRRSLDKIATVFRCRDATVLENYPYMKILSSTVVHLQQLRPEFGRHLRLWLSNIVGGQNDNRF